MEQTSDELRQSVLNKLIQVKQEHLIKLYDNSHPDCRKSKADELMQIDYALLDRLYSGNTNSSGPEVKREDISEIEAVLNPGAFDPTKRQAIRQRGLELIYQGKVAVYLLAGGQGSRLGFEKPKGMYNIQMPSNKSLFEYVCNRLLSAQTLSKSAIPKNSTLKPSPCKLFIQTSQQNHQETWDFFRANKFFGLGEENVFLFPQDMIETIDVNGKILAQSSTEIFRNPNGNGGCFITLRTRRIFETCEEHGIENFHVISIDNPLTKVLDPVFVGCHYENSSDCSAKFVPKEYPEEAVGVFIRYKGKPYMLDYGDFPKDLTLEKVGDQLKYRAGNILNYLLSVHKLKEILETETKFSALVSQYHGAKKSVKAFDLVKGAACSVEGFKFELFFNSIFEFCDKDILLIETTRQDEFAPVKKDDSAKVDCPMTARRKMTQMFMDWITRSGGSINGLQDESALGVHAGSSFEIDFRLSYEGENLEIFKGKKFELGDYIK